MHGFPAKNHQTILAAQANQQALMIVIKWLTKGIQGLAIHQAYLKRVLLFLLTQGLIVSVVHGRYHTLGRLAVSTPSSTTPASPLP